MMSLPTTTPPDTHDSIYDIFRFDRREELQPINLTLGNPNLKPPSIYYTVMHDVINELENAEWNGHGYIVEEDPFGLCNKIAVHLASRYLTPFEARDIGITVGATGALDVILKTIIDQHSTLQGEPKPVEVIILAPYFVEYINIIRANGGVAVVVNTNSEYGIAVDAIASAITPHTRAIIVNSPNNPTGRVYSAEELMHLAVLLKSKNSEYGTTITIIEDSVYDTILFSVPSAPSLIEHYPHLFRVHSYSKSMSLSGERIGYFAMHPSMGNSTTRLRLRSSLHLNMRMRVVHAPLLQHRILARLPADCSTDINYYKQNIQTLYTALTALGFIVCKPEGTFYLWAAVPQRYKSEEAFRTIAQQGPDPLLYLPGTLFGGSTYNNCVRFSACVAHKEILRACDKLKNIDTCF